MSISLIWQQKVKKKVLHWFYLWSPSGAFGKFPCFIMIIQSSHARNLILKDGSLYLENVAAKAYSLEDSYEIFPGNMQ